MAEAGQKEQTELPRLRVEDSETYQNLAVQEPSFREKTASRVAVTILVLFGLTLAGSFAVGIYLLSRSQGAVDQAAVEVSLAYLKTVGTLFTPLLGFILGYYFTRKEE